MNKKFKKFEHLVELHHRVVWASVLRCVVLLWCWRNIRTRFII